jgi:hypothetical protein
MLCAGAVPAAAHHSFAVFFDDTKTFEITGTVTEFRFTNPHGLITLSVDRNGAAETWRVETNAPTLLRRRGWTEKTLAAGDTITVTGWQARDGAKFLRMQRVARADGTVLWGPGASAPGARQGGGQR